MKTFRILALAALTLLVALAAAETAAETSAETWKPKPLPAAEETAEALAAGPPSIRDGAGVYLLAADGYVLARPSTNGFHCLVGRSQPEAFEPQCFDAEGSATLLPAVLLAAELVQAGHAPDEVEAGVAAAWAAGELRAPSRPGINYMLSEKNRVPVARDRVIPYGPHLMFYAPYLSNADFGIEDPTNDSPMFVINEGEPGAYVIVPVGGHG